MTTATPDPLRRTIIAVLFQLDHGEAGDLLGEGFDSDQAGYGDAVRDLTWCRNQLAEAIGLPEGTAIELDGTPDAPTPSPASATPTPAERAATCELCADAIAAWIVRMRGEISQVCNDCYATYYVESTRTDAWEADPIPPVAPAPIPADLTAAMAESARLAGKLRFLAGDVEAYIAEMKQRRMGHADDSLKALQQSVGIAEGVLRESNLHQPVLSEIALWKDGYHELARLSSLYLRTVNDVLRHGLTKTAEAKIDEVGRELAAVLGRTAVEGTHDA